MVIHDLYFVGISLSPLEANSPLVVDANAILPSTIPGELFEAVAGRNTQIFQLFCGIEYSEFPPGYPMQI